jgi:uncharacterized membrane protein YphA (DoxX/SURF4 family)
VTGPTIWQSVASGPDAILRRDRTAVRVAVLTGVIFVFAGLVKFVFHAWELRAFRAFGLPWPAGLEIFTGVLEIVGGALLAARLYVVPCAFLLAVTMVVAIGASGIGHGDVIPSLTLAPVLLVALTWLLVRLLRPVEGTETGSDRPVGLSDPRSRAGSHTSP